MDAFIKFEGQQKGLLSDLSDLYTYNLWTFNCTLGTIADNFQEGCFFVLRSVKRSNWRCSMISDDSKGHGILQNKISFTVPSLAFKGGNFKTV